MEFKIAEFDNDYNSLINVFFKEFQDTAEANQWCNDASWSGADYMVLEEYEENV